VKSPEELEAKPPAVMGFADFLLGDGWEGSGGVRPTEPA